MNLPLCPHYTTIFLRQITPFFAKNAPSFPKDNARDARVGASGVSRARPPADFGDLGDLGLLGERGVRTWRRGSAVLGAEPPEAAPKMAGKYPDQIMEVLIGLMVGRNLSKSKMFGCQVYWRVLISHLYL